METKMDPFILPPAVARLLIQTDRAKVFVGGGNIIRSSILFQEHIGCVPCCRISYSDSFLEKEEIDV